MGRGCSDDVSTTRAVWDPVAEATTRCVATPASTAAALTCEPRDAVVGETASVPVVAIVATGAPACEPRERSRDDDDDDAPGDAGTPRLDAGRPGRFEESFHVR